MSKRCRKIEHVIPWQAELDEKPAVGSVVGQLLPPGFPRYLRVLHPPVAWAADSVERIPQQRLATWAELAKNSGHALGPTLTLRQLDAGFSKIRAATGRIAVWEGKLEEATASQLYQSLDGNGAGPYLFGFGLMAVIAAKEHRPMLYEVDSLEDRHFAVDAIRRAGATGATTAEHVWPRDQRWIVCTDYDLVSSYVAASTGAARRLIDHPNIEAVLVERTTRIDRHADEQEA